jgi:DNA-binding CsgD family transcriptional regulator/PAS domain-containing protein
MRRRPGLSPESLSSLLQKLYGTPLDPGQWPVFLQEFSQMLGLPAVALHHHDFAHQEYQFNISAGMDLGALSLYEKHFGKLDPYWPEFLKLPEAELTFGETLCPTRKLRKTEFYQDFLSTHDDILGVYAAVAMVKQPYRWQAITVYRRLSDRHPGPETAAIITAVSPHIRAALQLQQHVADLSFAKISLESGIDALGLAVLLLDERGLCIFASQKAERIVARGNGLLIRNGKLSAELHSDSVALSFLIARTLATANVGDVRPAAPVFVSRSLQGALRISAIALSRTAPRYSVITSRRAAAIFFIRDMDDDTKSLPALLGIVYGLTKAEARLSVLLYEGRSLVEAAETNGVSTETVRAQLRSVFQKTNVHRQAALIRLLNELANTQ